MFVTGSGISKIACNPFFFAFFPYRKKSKKKTDYKHMCTYVCKHMCTYVCYMHVLSVRVLDFVFICLEYVFICVHINVYICICSFFFLKKTFFIPSRADCGKSGRSSGYFRATAPMHWIHNGVYIYNHTHTHLHTCIHTDTWNIIIYIFTGHWAHALHRQTKRVYIILHV